MLHISKQKGVKIAQMAMKTKFVDVYIAECFFAAILSNWLFIVT